MKELPALDLSKYNSYERLPIKIERIIVQALIFYKMNINAVSSKFKIEKEKVSEIAVTYYSEIVAAVASKTDISKVNSALTSSAALLSEHVKNIKKSQKRSNSKILKESELQSLCKIIDRLNGIQGNYSKLSEISTVKLSSTINTNRTAEANIEGKVEDNSDYNENQQAVFEMLNSYKGYDPSIPVIVKDIIDNTEQEFSSLKATADHFSTTPEYIKRKIDKKTLYKDRYIIQIKETNK